MESVWSILSLQQSTSESELVVLLSTFTVAKLKLLCKENVTMLSDDWLRRGSQRATFLQRRATQAQPKPSTCLRSMKFVRG